MKWLSLRIFYSLFFFSQFAAANPPAPPTEPDCKTELMNRPIRVVSRKLRDELAGTDLVNPGVILKVEPGSATSVNELWSNAMSVHAGTVLDLYAVGTAPKRTRLGRFFASPQSFDRQLFVERPYAYSWLSGQAKPEAIWNTLNSSHLLYSVQHVQSMGYDPSSRRGAKFMALPDGFKVVTFSDYSAWYDRYEYAVITVKLDPTRLERVVSVDIKVYKNATAKDWDTNPGAEGTLYRHLIATDFSVILEK